jgi:hypothetical protein
MNLPVYAFYMSPVKSGHDCRWSVLVSHSEYHKHQVSEVVD